MPKPERTAAILVAAGRGLRAGAGGPKQYRSIGGQTVIFRAMEPFCRHPRCLRGAAGAQSRRHRDVQRRRQRAAPSSRRPMAARRGRPRCMPASKRSPASEPDIVLIHDAARPFVSAALISRAIDAAGRTGAAIPAIPVTDTIKLVDGSGNVEATPERARLRIAQTPQAFRFDVILDAHRRAAREGRSDFTDDAALAEWAGLTVATFEGDPANMKLTTPEDFVREEARLGASARRYQDRHRLRRARLRRRRSSDDLRRARAAHTRLSRPFRRRCRPARAGRRHPRRAGGRRHRLAFSAERSASGRARPPTAS